MDKDSMREKDLFDFLKKRNLTMNNSTTPPQKTPATTLTSTTISTHLPRKATHTFNDNHKIRRTVALYSDELRFSIIEEVFKRPLLWDSSNREPAALLQRKEFFEEIADDLRHLDETLNGIIVEKQWKNLKDTFNKVKKKITLDENGAPIYPKWRFYNTMSFIDHENTDSEKPTSMDETSTNNANNKFWNNNRQQKNLINEQNLSMVSQAPYIKNSTTETSAHLTTTPSQQNQQRSLTPNYSDDDEYALFWGIRLGRFESP